MSTHFKYTLFTLFIAFFTFAAGYYVGQTGVAQPASSGQPSISQPPVSVPDKKGSYEQGYQEALDFARQKLMEGGEFEPVNSVIATVKSINGQNIVVEFDATLLDPFADGMATKTIVAGGDTQLYERTVKDEAQFEKEYEAFEKAVDAYRTALEANPDAEDLEAPKEPQEYTMKMLVASDFMEGDRVQVLADLIVPDKVAEGEEAVMISPFVSDTVEATEVRLYPRPEPEPEEEMKEAAEETSEELMAEEPEVPEGVNF